MAGKARRSRGQTVCVLSPHPLILEEMHALLDRTGFRVQTSRLGSVLPPDLRHLRLCRASLYVVDANLPSPTVEAVVAGILDRFPASHVLVLTEKITRAQVFPLIRLGVKGLVSYQEARRRLPEALRVVIGGAFWGPRAVLSAFVNSVSSDVCRRGRVPAAYDMSRREREVLDAVLQSLSNKEIAGKLHISERTVKFHVSNLLAKFGAERRNELILRFLRDGRTDS